MESDINVNEIICSDICEPLIELWNQIKYEPDKVSENYKTQWLLFQKDSNYYYEVRKRFNSTPNPNDFLFLLRTCANGLARFNLKGGFNSPVHHGRPGIKPNTLEKIIHEWSDLLVRNNVKFVMQDYQQVNSKQGDLLYLDPPYINTKGMYYGILDYKEFWNWLNLQEGRYILSFDGITGCDNRTYEVPKHLYDKHVYIDSGCSSFKRLHGKVEYVKESLYLKVS